MQLKTIGPEHGRLDDIFTDFQAAIAIRPSYEAYNLMAWTLATCPDARFRDGKQAVALAKKAVAMNTEVRSLATLAAAVTLRLRKNKTIKAVAYYSSNRYQPET